MEGAEMSGFFFFLLNISAAVAVMLSRVVVVVVKGTPIRGSSLSLSTVR